MNAEFWEKPSANCSQFDQIKLQFANPNSQTLCLKIRGVIDQVRCQRLLSRWGQISSNSPVTAKQLLARCEEGFQVPWNLFRTSQMILVPKKQRNRSKQFRFRFRFSKKKYIYPEPVPGTNLEGEKWIIFLICYYIFFCFSILFLFDFFSHKNDSSNTKFNTISVNFLPPIEQWIIIFFQVTKIKNTSSIN